MNLGSDIGVISRKERIKGGMENSSCDVNFPGIATTYNVHIIFWQQVADWLLIGRRAPLSLPFSSAWNWW